jgi:hypothetical protein
MQQLWDQSQIPCNGFNCFCNCNKINILNSLRLFGWRGRSSVAHTGVLQNVAQFCVAKHVPRCVAAIAE